MHCIDGCLLIVIVTTGIRFSIHQAPCASVQTGQRPAVIHSEASFSQLYSLALIRPSGFILKSQLDYAALSYIDQHLEDDKEHHEHTSYFDYRSR